MQDIPVRIEQIDALLPQTQCTQCGYDGCRPYAEAIAGQGAAINRCPPGGQQGVAALAALLDRPEIPLDPACGAPGPLRVAVIDEKHCIGCTLCIQACPVDAIVGANKRMHTVLADWCTGCDLCVPVCPVDCIEMRAAQRAWTPQDAAAARQRHGRRNARRAQEQAQEARRLAQGAAEPAPAARQHAPEDPEARKRQAVAQALARARARRQSTPQN
ncbi:electron transport complex subunit RsxB [Orrella sp. JC864]|uniref:electron transport complex subunit RsxB n=1 Tax=Orrella sp. JC864 TaxID=3120298 RepID=UPI003009608E